MGKTPEIPEASLSFLKILGNVMSDPDYLVGSEPEGSNWDFHNWPGYNFKDFGDWVEAEKFFSIPTIDGRRLSIRIIQTDPHQFSVETPEGDVPIIYVIGPVSAKGFPTILIGNDKAGNEYILRNKHEPIELHSLPDVFRDLATEVGMFENNTVTSDKEGNQWALFIINILKGKRILPAHFQPLDKVIRDQLELEPKDKITEKEIRLTEMLMLQQELLSFAYADYILTE